jgi:hypothetical protein
MENWKINPDNGTLEKVEGISATTKKKIISSAPEVQEVPNERILNFKEHSDLSIVQIVDNDTRTVLGYIAGYALDMEFNMKELNSVEQIEKFLDGMKKAFRQIILEKTLNKE